MNVLTGPLLRDMIYESFDRINEKVDYLNDINVFPVPDGDTGVNLYITLETVVQELQNKQDDLSIKEAAKAIAKGAFKGAKGNSGVILSQFFMGFAKSVEDLEEITPQSFAEALIEGSKKAY
ncbi:MAG: DAK2 domain-containing protein, partial [Candidatus Kariarchaeaceae archaeon]